MIHAVHLEVVFAVGYSVFLVGAALTLELLARHSHRRSQTYRTAGFAYNHQLDFWKCPAGSHLVRINFDEQRRIARYRAPARTCNSCPLKNNCTNSEEGRELEHHLESWIQSELRHFHRGISVTLLVLAALILFLEATRHSDLPELTVLCLALMLVLMTGSRLLPALMGRNVEIHRA